MAERDFGITTRQPGAMSDGQAGDAVGGGAPAEDSPRVVSAGSPVTERSTVPEIPTLAAAKAAERCCVCESVKSSAQPVCQSDWMALTLAMRLAIGKASNAAAADVAFRSAVLHLRGLPKYRRVRVIETAGGDGEARRNSSWRLHSDAEMEAAGFRFIGHQRCGAPTCSQRIVWYWTPRKKKMAVNLDDYQPHPATCKDPGYNARMRENKRARRRANSAARRRRTR